MDRHILAVLVLNKTGVLNKITGLYARRALIRVIAMERPKSPASHASLSH